MILGDIPQKIYNNRVLFISGIDTNVGKTYATAHLLVAMQKAGHNVISQKMIQTGCKEISEDIEKHREITKTPLLPEDIDGTTSPIVLSYPASPHLAAQIDNTTIDVTKIDSATNILLNKFSTVLLEGAGGLMVPISTDINSPLGGYLTIDYIAKHNYPVVLVTSGKLGSLNHTLLSIDACNKRGIEIALIVYNEYPSTDTIIEKSSLNYLESLNIPVVVLSIDK